MLVAPTPNGLLQEDPGPRPHGLERSADCHPKPSARTQRIGVNFPPQIAPACLLFPWGLPLLSGLDSGGVVGEVGVGEGEIVIFAQTEKGCHYAWHWPPLSALRPRGLPGTSGLGTDVLPVAHADFRVPAAADLRTELSFPRQKTGRAAGSVQTPKALLATPPNSPELKLRNFRPGQRQKEANQDVQMGAAGSPTFSRVTGRLG